jgi:hypothetical protein
MDQTNKEAIHAQLKLNTAKPGCGCSGSIESKSVISKNLPRWVSGSVSTSVGTIYQVATEWKWPDYWGHIKSRTTAFRMHYSVEPGLYAVGNPDTASEVFVSANYKLSFDILRRELHGINAWILVLDTKGINVWCAAGKGTFGTDELIKRIIKTKLSALVDHKRIIVPQLGAPGIAADHVKRTTGFHVYYGPIRAADIQRYLRQKYHASTDMRTVRFSFFDRMVLTPIELNPAFKIFPVFAIVALGLVGLQPSGILFKDALNEGLPIVIFGILSIVSGALLMPLLLPYIPVRSFAIKGWMVGMVVIFLSSQFIGLLNIHGIFLKIFCYLFFPIVSSFLALNFTGATTFTNLSGVKKELRIVIPVYLSITAVSIGAMILYKINEWGLI